MVLTVKRLKEVIEDFDDDKLVGFVDPYGKFHTMSVDDVYMATGHHEPSQPDMYWGELIRTTKPKRVVHLNTPQVGVPRGEFKVKNQDHE